MIFKNKFNMKIFKIVLIIYWCIARAKREESLSIIWGLWNFGRFKLNKRYFKMGLLSIESFNRLKGKRRWSHLFFMKGYSQREKLKFFKNVFRALEFTWISERVKTIIYNFVWIILTKSVWVKVLVFWKNGHRWKMNLKKNKI